MTQDATPVEVAGEDPRSGLEAVKSLRELADTLEAVQVGNARELGWTWQQIADVLEVTRQAVHKKHGRVVEGAAEG